MKGFQKCRSEIDARALRMEIIIKGGIEIENLHDAFLSGAGDPNPIACAGILRVWDERAPLLENHSTKRKNQAWMNGENWPNDWHIGPIMREYSKRQTLRNFECSDTLQQFKVKKFILF